MIMKSKLLLVFALLCFGCQFNKLEAKGEISVYCSMNDNAKNQVKVSWFVSDDLLAKTFCVYCSVDGGEYLLWTPDTKNTEMVYFVPKGHIYKFAVTARNYLGNKLASDLSCNVTFDNRNN